MADNVIDTLSIQIDSSSRSASRAINSVIGNLERLSNALGTFSDSTSAFNIEGIENGITRLNSAVSKLDVTTIQKASTSMRALSLSTSSLSNSLSRMNTAAFGALSSGLSTLSSSQAKIPDLGGLSSLASNVSKLGYKNSIAGIQNLPRLASGLSAMQGIVIPDFGNIDGLANLISVLGRLGGKKGSAAATNIQPMINGIRELSQLSNINVPDANGLLALANAFSALGRSTTGRAIQNIPQLAVAFSNLMRTLSTAPQVSDNVIRLAEALAKLPSSAQKVTSSTKGIERTLSGIMTRSRETSTKILSFGKNLLFSRKSADSAGRSYTTLAAKVGLLYAKFWMILRVVRMFSGMIEVASSLTEVQNVVDTTFGKLSGKVEQFSKNAIQSFGMSELSAKKFASQFQAMGTAMGITGAQVKKATDFINTKKTADGLTAGYNKASNSMADMSINLTKLAADMASFYDVEQETVAKALQSGVMAGQTRPLRTYGLDLTQATLQEWALNNGLNANVKTMTQAEKTMLRYQYVMANSARAQGDFLRTSNTWHNQVVILKQQLQQLAVVIGSGLIQAIKPFVMQMNAALSGLIQFSQKVVNALGKIFGWEMEVNTKGLTLDDDMLDVDTSGLEDAVDTTDKLDSNIADATKAAKKFKDQLQGFDKLNVLRTTETNPNSGSGKGKDNSGATTPTGSGSGLTPGEVEARLKKTKGEFESKIDNLFELGRYISDALSKQLEGIKWDKVYEKARSFASGLASFLNGLITPRLFANVGKTLVNSINTAFHFLDEFGKDFKFGNFGRSIAAGLNAFFQGFDWKTMYSAAKRWGVGLATMLNEIMENTDFMTIGATISKKLRLALTFLYNFANTLNFEKIGKSVADAVNGFINNFPAKQLAETINKWVGGVFDMVVTALDNIEWGKIADKIKEFISNLDFKTVAIIIGALSLIKGASFTVSIGSAIMDEVTKIFIKQLASKLAPALATDPTLQKSIGEGVGKAAAEGGASGAGMAIAGIVGAFGGLMISFGAIRKMWSEGWSLMGEIVKDVGIAIAGAMLVLGGVITAPVALIVGGIVAAVTTIGILLHDHWDEISTGASETWKGLKEGVGRATSGIAKTWKDFKTNTVTTVTQMNKDISTGWATWKKENGERFHMFVEDSKKKFREFKENSSTTFEDVRKTISDKLKTAKEFAHDRFEDIKGFAKFSWSLPKVGLDAVKKVPGIVEDIVDKIKEAFDFDIDFPDIKLPHIRYHWKDIGGVVSIPVFDGIDWYAKAYDNPMMFTKPTVLPNMKGFGDGNGGEMVYGHQNLMDDIREASGNSEMTAIGNRQLANDQRIIQLLSIIAEKEFGISSRDVFSAVRSEASNYTMRTGKGAFEY